MTTHSNVVYDQQPRTTRPRASYQFDPASKDIHDCLPLKHHRSRSKLQSVTRDKQDSIIQECENNRSAAKNGLSYEQFLSGTLYRDEEMVNNGILHYKYVSFHKVKEETTVSSWPTKERMNQGRMFLTNHRIILLAAEESQDLSFSTDPPDSVVPSHSYLISGRCSDVLHFQSIPLGCIKSLELNASTGVKVEATINDLIPCCCLRLFSCCGEDECLKTWHPQDLPPTATNERMVTIGAALPPWGHKYFVEIRIKENIPLQYVKEIIKDLQHYAPDLYTGALAKKE